VSDQNPKNNGSQPPATLDDPHLQPYAKRPEAAQAVAAVAMLVGFLGFIGFGVAYWVDASTQWQAITKDFRFYIENEKGGMVMDRGRPTQWYPHNLTNDLHTDDDYAVVSRVFDPETRAVVVLVSGATQYGTEGAAQLVTNPDMLRDALRDRPPGWETKNLQIVLHMKVIANSPAATSVAIRRCGVLSGEPRWQSRSPSSDSSIIPCDGATRRNKASSSGNNAPALAWGNRPVSSRTS